MFIILLLLLISAEMRFNRIVNLSMNYINKKSIISISPGGYKGFYQLGIGSFIKDNYNTNNYLFSGASAGAWVSLMMVYKGNHHTFINNLIKWTNELNTPHLHLIQKQIKHKLITNYHKDDFDLKEILNNINSFSKITRRFINNNI